MHRRELLVAGLGTAAWAATGCVAPPGPGAPTTTVPPIGPTPLPPPGSVGLVDEVWWQSRVDTYLGYATTQAHSSSPTGTVAHLARARRDPSHSWDPAAATETSLSGTLGKIDRWEDTRDFGIMYLLWLLALGGDQPGGCPPILPEPTLEAIRSRLIANRWRWNDPLPADRVDNLWYWSENHRLIVLACEYLAGQMLPEETFTITGLTGDQHRERARPLLFDWFTERARFGFFEWHSNVYMLKNITPLLNLTELVDGDDELVIAAATALDMCLLDLAAHQHRCVIAAPHGRSYAKDTMRGPLEDTWSSCKFLFDSTSLDWNSRADNGATYLAAASRYRPPQVVRAIGADAGPRVVKERHGVYFDDTQPVSPNVAAPFGYDWNDDTNLPFWWSLGAVGMWPLAHTAVREANEHRLWETELFSDITLLAQINGFDPDRIAEWEQENAAVLNFGFLGEANTYLWRSPEVSLASVIDHRKGAMRDQARAWKAVVGAEALVFTQHPATPPPSGTEWRDDSSPGYWTGEASLPRSAQHGSTAIHIYRPAWDAENVDPILWSVFGYEPYTHAYVPTERFDEVYSDWQWTFLRKGDAYIALWSDRDTHFRHHSPGSTPTGGLTEPFDLVAEGGPDNVWICQVGRRADDGGFHDFADALRAAPPQVTDGHIVEWDHPTKGLITFSWEGDFVVDGAVQSLEHERLESPWGTVGHLDTVHTLNAGGASWTGDPSAGRREIG